MWKHTEALHERIIGPERGKDDCKVVVTDHFRDNKKRQIQEGIRQTRNEKFKEKIS